ncbi:transcriptional regulator, IclR family [Lachnospiraceae bacterium NK3A20]|jgi:DNA-binding IclR family transcriptional regulator|nr:transcriptional regulator, IclR family [Lachnospiraceae bacterium NK3A20]
MAEDKNPIQVAGRLFGALEYLADHGQTGLTELSEGIGLNKSTAHRVVASLEYMGYVKQNPDNGRYEPTFKLADLANRIMDRVDIIQTIRPHLQKLSETCQETVHLVKRENAEVVYIDKVESYQNNVRMVSHVGSRIPFYRSAVGKALAANMPEEAVKKLWEKSRIERMTPYTITNYEDFLDGLEDVRRKGYALDNEENETGVRCIAVALDISGDNQTYAFSISVPVARMDNDRIRELSGYLAKAREEIDAEFSRG